MLELIRFVFEIMVAILLLVTCISSFVHARKGRDIAGLTFGMAFFVLFVSKAALLAIFIYTGFKNWTGSHVNTYIWWYVALSYIPFALGCFTSIFASGKNSSAVWAPLLLVMSAVFALPFFESIMPAVPRFSVFGGFIWLVAAVFLLATSMMYFFYNFKAADRFRFWMGIGFVLLALSCGLNIFSGSTGFFYLLSVLLQFGGIFVIFYEVTYA